MFWHAGPKRTTSSGKREPGSGLGPLVLERLMHYLHLVAEQLQERPHGRVSSQQLAELLGMDDTLVRKDMAAIGVRGRPRVGFSMAELRDAIRVTLGFDESHKAIIVGAGRLGGALASYSGFMKYGLYIVALFDTDLERIGSVQGTVLVQNLDTLEAVITRHGVKLAILTVPADSAQRLAERLVAAGIRAIWNFAPTSLVVPPDVFVRHEHISVGLGELAYFLKQQRTGPPAQDQSVETSSEMPPEHDPPTENRQGESALSVE